MSRMCRKSQIYLGCGIVAKINHLRNLCMKQIFHMQKGELFSLSSSYRHLRLNTKANLIKNLSNLHKTNSTTFLVLIKL